MTDTGASSSPPRTVAEQSRIGRLGVGAPRPFVDRPLLDLASARGLAESVTDELDLPPPRLVRHGMNAVFRCGDVAIRVGHPTAPPEASADLSEWVASLGVVVPRPVAERAGGLPARTLVVGAGVDGHRRDGDEPGETIAATLWEWIEPLDVPVDWHRVGAMLARLHAADIDRAPAGFPLPHPWRFPWWDFAGLFAALHEHAVGADADAFAAMLAVVDRHAGWNRPPRPFVLCHGDVHPGNVIMSDRGAVLLDWDLACVAPPGWDHAPMMRWATHWGGAATDYEGFAAGYGRSMVGDPFAEAVADLRLVAATLMRVRAADHDPAARPEAQRRLDSWRTVDVGPWHAQ